MKNVFDISDFVNTPTIQFIMNSLVLRVKERRKELKISQKQLAERSGVSYASVRRFENTGEISLCFLLKIANTLDCLEDFNLLFKKKTVTNIKDLDL